MSFKVMTYNIQHGLDYKKLINKERVINLDRICEIIKKENPDIIGLNEVYNDIYNIETVEQAKYIASKLGYNYYHFGQSITIKNNIGYGNAVISKYDIKNFKIHKIEDPIIKDENVYYESRIIIECDIDINGELIKVLVTHIGLAKKEQENGIKKIVNIIDNNKEKKIILMGDFNMEENDENIKVLLNYINNTSSLINGNKLTFNSINPSVKIDYIFLKNLEPLNCYIVNEIGSDHLPIICIIK